MSDIAVSPKQGAMLNLLLGTHFDVKAGDQEWRALLDLNLIEVKEGTVFEEVQYEHVLRWRCTLSEAGKAVLRDFLRDRVKALKAEQNGTITLLRRLLNRNELASKEMILDEAGKVASATERYHNLQSARLENTGNFLELGGRIEELED